MSPRPPTPALTVDVIIEVDDRPPGADGATSSAGSRGAGDRDPATRRPEIVLIERRNPPHGWALPGGFVDVGETVEEAAVREAREETGLEVQLVRQFHVYSDPGRDARGHTVSVVFVGRARGVPQAASDAARAKVFAPTALPEPIAFDHAEILSDYVSGRY